jgi:hypothetical protein
MRNETLIKMLLEHDLDVDVKLDAVFNADGASTVRAVVVNGHDVVLRDYFMQNNGDLVVKCGDCEYELVK